MDDLISRQAAIEALRKRMDISAKGEIGSFYNQVIIRDIDLLESLPSAQPDRKTGHWIKIHWKAYRCSECNRASEYSTDYCPNCGARMEGEDNEAD